MKRVQVVGGVQHFESGPLPLDHLRQQQTRRERHPQPPRDVLATGSLPPEPCTWKGLAFETLEEEETPEH